MTYEDALKWEKFYDLRKTYKACMAQGWFTSRRRAFHVAVKKPYPSFYITAEYCVKLFRWLETDNPKLKNMREPTRRKLDYLYNRYLEIHKEEPDLPKIEICERIVNETAPELFMDGNSAYNFFLDMQKKERLIKKLRNEI